MSTSTTGHCRHGKIHRQTRGSPTCGDRHDERRQAGAGALSIDLARPARRARRRGDGASEKYKAIAAGAVVMDVKTGEVVAMASVPDYDPNNPADGPKTAGSTACRTARSRWARPSRASPPPWRSIRAKVKITTVLTPRAPIRIGGFTIKDFHGKGRVLTVPEIFQYSSNIGTAKMPTWSASRATRSS
jgi:cell division protein FtsI (penicillin-binding protein 3)